MSRLFTEAWIETPVQIPQWVEVLCRLFTEAWIETVNTLDYDEYKEVASSRRRGLKQVG